MAADFFCFLNLGLTYFYLLIFLIATSYLLIKNRCNFNSKTKVVLFFFSILMLMQVISATLFYLDLEGWPECHQSFTYITIMNQQDIVQRVSYQFIICRMMSIYYRVKI